MIYIGKLIDLTGQKFGRLTVKYRGENDKHKHVQWWCLCDCQLELPEDERNLILIRGDSLTSNNTRSCGCYNNEIRSITAKKRLKKYNTYDLETKEYGIGYTSKGEEFWFDKEDYDLIKDYCWSYNKGGYLISYYGYDNIRIRFSRLVMGVIDDKSVDVDHIKHNLYDNRKSQLRLVTSSQNHMNMVTPTNNTSGCKGVLYDKRRNKWVVKITVNNEIIYLGGYDNFDDAVKVRKDAEEKYYGEWSYDNSQAM